MILGRKTTIALICIASLSACSTATSPPEPQEVSTSTARTGAAAAYSFSYQPTSGTPDRVLRALPSAGWFYYPDTLAGIPSDFGVFLQSTEGYLLRGVTADGGGEVIIVDNGAQLTRTGATLLPVAVEPSFFSPGSGSVAYTGTYAAIVIDAVRDMAPETVSGSARVDVDFADMTASGQITDRLYDGSFIADDVLLNTSSLTDGAFSGTTSGGDFNTGGLVAADGVYTGLIVGAEGGDIVGAVTINHTGSENFVEQGGMILSQ